MSAYPFDPFAETAQIRRTECRNGITYKDLAQTACNVYTASLGQPTYVLQEADLTPWEAVAGKAASIIDLPESEQGELSISAKTFAKTLYTQYTLERDKNPDWDEESAKVSWEAVGRHMANLIDSVDNRPDFPELEEKIVNWAKERNSVPQLILS